VRLGQVPLAVDERGAGEEVAEPVLKALAQVAHQKDDLALLEADIEQVERQGEAEGIECGVVGLGAAAAVRGLNESKGAGRLGAECRDVEVSIEVEQTLDPGLEDRGRSVAGGACKRERAPERPFDLTAPVRDVAHVDPEKKF